MTCGCGKDRLSVQVRSNGCRFCCPSSVWWRPKVSCYAWRCYNPLMLSQPPEWAFGDSFDGEIVEGADWIVVRSCFCRREMCPHFG